jgi:hypothetical protein
VISRRFLPDVPTFSEVYEAGREIIHALLARASDNFERRGKSLSYKEYNETNFRASAYRERPDADEFCIVFSPNVPGELFRGISAFVDMAANTFGGEAYATVFGDVTGPNCIGILPDGWSVLECRDTIFERAIVWLFHHELGHLLQDHERLRKENAPENASINLFVDEAMNNSDDLAAGTRLSWVYHATELAADHQALHYSLFYATSDQVVASAKEVSPASIWCFVSAVAYMFHYFYGDRTYASISPVAEATHPDPTIRLAMLTAHLVQLLELRSVQTNNPSVPPTDEIERLISSSQAAMGAYWALSHTDKDLKLPAVLSRLLDFKEEIREYMTQLTEVWGDLRPEVMKTYFGENSSHVMDIRMPAESDNGR